MVRLILLTVALASACLGLLTVVRIPDWLDWRFTVLACSFGYALAAVPLAAGLVSAWLPGARTPLGWGTAAVSAAACILLFQPCLQAWWIGRDLPARLARELGPFEVPSSPFSFMRLLRRWPEAAPHRTVTYSGTQQLDFYPAIGRPKAPCVLVVHGGGWNDGDRGQISQFNDALARGGYAVADLSYRLAPAAVWPAQREDVAAAVAFVKAHAREWGVDPGRLILLGRSAGGQIAEASAYSLRDPAIRGVIGLYAPADMHFAWEWSRPDDALNSPKLLREFLGGTPQTARAAYDSASAILQVAPDSPPTLLVHGTIDTLVWVRQSRRLADALAAKRVRHALVELPWATHALEFNPDSPSGQLCAYSVDAFLSAVCR